MQYDQVVEFVDLVPKFHNCSFGLFLNLIYMVFKFFLDLLGNKSDKFLVHLRCSEQSLGCLVFM